MSELEQMEERIVEKLVMAFNPRFDSIDRRFEAVDKRFEAMDRRFDEMDQRFEAMDRRFDEMDQRFEAMDQRFEAMDQRFEAMDQRFDEIEADIYLINYSLDHESKSIRNELKKLDDRVHNLEILAQERWNVPELFVRLEAVEHVVAKHTEILRKQKAIVN